MTPTGPSSSGATVIRYGPYYTYTTIRRLEHSMRITRRMWPRVFSELNVDWDPVIVDWLHDVAATLVPS